jgi:hypothetical protein
MPPNKCHFFFWLVLHGRNWTSKGCHGAMASVMTRCAIKRVNRWTTCWPHACMRGRSGSRTCNVVDGRGSPCFTMPPSSNGGWWLLMRKRNPKSRHKAFDSLTILCAWSNWLECNARVSEGCSSSPAMKLDAIWALCDLWCRAKFLSWSCLIPGIGV